MEHLERYIYQQNLDNIRIPNQIEALRRHRYIRTTLKNLLANRRIPNFTLQGTHIDNVPEADILDFSLAAQQEGGAKLPPADLILLKGELKNG